jgi:DNA-binding beta-propeller fold protein YncE
MSISKAAALGLAAATMAAAGAPSAASAGPHRGAVFTITNAAAGNRVLVFTRGAAGRLRRSGAVATGGLGSGANLGSQSSIALAPGGGRLYAVNAGSDSLSVLGVDGARVWRERVVGSGGADPISVTAGRSWVYVLNAGGTPGVTGFRVTQGGLARINGGSRQLTAADITPEQVSLSPSGRTLVVTNKTSSTIDTFAVHRDGSLGPARSQASAGAGPYGFAFTPSGRLIVSDAAQAPTSAATSYRIDRHGLLHTVSGPLQTNQLAACWVAITPDGRFAYVADAHSGTVSGLAVARNGAISLLDASGITASGGAGSTTLDEAVSPGGRLFSVLVMNTRPGLNAILVFRIAADGSLHRVARTPGLPATTSGLAMG